MEDISTYISKSCSSIKLNHQQKQTLLELDKNGYLMATLPANTDSVLHSENDLLMENNKKNLYIINNFYL